MISPYNATYNNYIFEHCTAIFEYLNIFVEKIIFN